MYTDKLVNLQLFAEGGEGAAAGNGGGETAGVTPDAAGQETMADRLRKMGVPEAKLQKRAYKTPIRTDHPENGAAQVAAEKETAEAPKEDAHPLPTWDDYMADPQNAQKLKDYTSGIVQSRLKDAKATEEKLSKLTPALEVLAAKYGTDAADLDGLVRAVTGDKSLYTQRAIEMGMDEDTLMKKDADDRETARIKAENEQLRAQLQQDAQQKQFQAHIAKLNEQGQALKKQFPSFDLQKEMANPRFVRMTSPSGGMTVEEAFFAIHREEILKANAEEQSKRTANALSQTLQANRGRPQESVSRQASSVPVFNPRTASAEQRDALRKKIRSGARVIPGHEFD